MINRVVLVGRLTRDIELRKTNSGLSTTTFTLACDRRYSANRDSSQPTADFISCVAWRQQADFLASYAHKGDVIALDGHITTRNYEGANGRVYVTEVTCENVRLVSSRRDNQGLQAQAASPGMTQGAPMPSMSSETSFADDAFEETPSLDISSDDLPFY